MFRLAVSLLWLVMMFRPATADDGRVDFGRDVRPILSDKCFRCHGPDSAARQADLRLDLQAEAFAAGAIQPHSPSESELISRILSKDPELLMPPPAIDKPLTEAEKDLLQRWIAQGADYEQHWAFVPPVRPAVPDADSSWARNPIDHFVWQRLQQQSLQPAEVADSVTLTRRLYLDTLGLPPSPAELDRLTQTTSAADFDRLTAELLESPHFGEKWARWWLDAARYADSDGYEKDKQRSVWFYRDWVIGAMNSNLPYDQFIIQQIAGDLLPNADQDERVATGFLRNSMVNEEGGADPEQFRIEGMFDRIDAIGKAILGITTQCAQCHTHKYDPLSHREYYQMFAALNDFHEASMSVFTPQQAEQRDQVLAAIRELEEQLKQRYPDWQQRLAAWEAGVQQRPVHWQGLRPSDIPYEGQKFRVLDDGSIVSESYAPTKTTNTFSLTIDTQRITAFRLDALMHPQLPRGGPGRSIYGTGAVTEFEVAVAPANDPGNKRRIELVRAVADANPPQSDLPAAFREKDPAQDDRITGPIEFAIDGDGKTAWSTDVGPGRRNQPRHAIFFPAEPLELEGEHILSFTLKQNHGGWNSDDNQNYLLGRYRFSITADDVAAEVLPATVEEILRTPPAERTPEQLEQLFSHWRTTVAELSEFNEQIDLLWQQFPETDSQLVVESRGEPRESYVFARGDFLSPAEPVAAATPEFLGAWPESEEPPRLRFARWLVQPDAPTTARVIVNRVWQAYFGRGLVATPEDFGYQSEAPSHPDLLDWLAVELVESGWDLKHIHRLILQSATYRQSSVTTPAASAADPANVWLGRGARFRVDAEVIRDIALSASGLLNSEIGGPSVYPPAPEFLFEPPASYGPKIWHAAGGSDQYRRSLYVHQYRSVPFPVLQVFDAPKGDAACVRRERSNTPLQALVLLNEPQFVECAEALAGRVLTEAGPGVEQRLAYAHRLVVGRLPESHELTVLRRLLEQQQSRVAASEIDFEGSGLSADQRTVWPWFVVARTLLNLDETITKQ